MFLIHVSRSGFQENFLHDFSRYQRKTILSPCHFLNTSIAFLFPLLLRTLANLHSMPYGRLSGSPAGSQHHHMQQICQVFCYLQTFLCQCLSSLNSSDIKHWETLLGTTYTEGIRYLILFLIMSVITGLATNLWFHCSSSGGNVAIRAVFVAFDIACTSQFKLIFSFLSSTHPCSGSISAFLFPHPVLTCIPCTRPCYTGAQWCIPQTFYLVH